MIQEEKEVFDRLEEDYKYLEAQGYTVLFVALQGSQNYNLSYEGSDIDTKAVLLPSFEDFCLNKKPVSTTIIKEDNSHLDIKDIRLMHDCFRKQNINFLEVLFTKYKIVNPKFADLYQPMFDRAEEIAHYNNYAAVNCIAGMVFEKRHALCHPYPAWADKIAQYGYSNKELHHIIRCEEFLKRYINGTPYAECLIPTNPQHLIDVKASYIYTVDEAIEISDNIVEIVKDVKQRYMDTHSVCINENVYNMMNEVLVDVLKRSFMEELSK